MNIRTDVWQARYFADCTTGERYWLASLRVGSNVPIVQRFDSQRSAERWVSDMLELTSSMEQGG